MSTIATIILFIAVLAILVLVHEFGHFITAKRFKIRVDEFGFGFPPRIFGRKIKGTLYSVNWIPLGGFVKIKGVPGDQKEESELHEKDSFAAQAFWKKFTILFAGIGMNIVLAVVVFAVIFSIGVRMPISGVEDSGHIFGRELLITTVLPGGPAQQAGILPGDTIIEYDQAGLTRIAELKERTQRAGVTASLVLEREEETISLEITPKEIIAEGRSYIGIGVGLEELGTIRYPWYQSVWVAMQTTVSIIGQIFVALWGLLVSLFSAGTVSEDLAGPIGIAVLTGQVAQLGIISLLQFIALLSINLAIFNLLPIPALDGGRILFVIIEKIRRKPIDHRIEAIIHNTGFLLLLALVLLVTLRDVSQYNIFGFMTSLFS